jgi:hypothetical protein
MLSDFNREYVSEPLSDAGITAILKRIQRLRTISKDSIQLIQMIFKPLNDSLMLSSDVNNFIRTNIPPELARNAISEYETAHLDYPDLDVKPVIMEYLIGEVLELSGDKAGESSINPRGRERNTIRAEHVIAVVRSDQELNRLLFQYFPLFPYNEVQLRYPIGYSITNYKLMDNAIKCLINYYGDKATQIELINFVDKVITSINRYFVNGELIVYNFFSLLNAIYNNPDLTTIPWETIFRQCS